MAREARTGGRGRQAEAERNDRALLDAARTVFAVHGPDAAVATVAAAAGVGIASLYRRFPTKAALLAHLCRSSMEQQVEAAERALANGADPGRALAAYVGECVSFRAGALASLAGTVPVTPEMAALARRSGALLDELVARARAAGTLRPDVAGTDVLALIILFSRRPTDEDAAHERLLAIALAGLRSTDGELPGRPSPWTEQAERWRVRQAGDGAR